MTVKKLINFSNHPSHLWSEKQKEAALLLGIVEDLPFPMVDEEASEGDVKCLALEFLGKVKSLGNAEEITIHIMGEQTFCFYFICEAKKNGYTCIASTSKRIVTDKANGQKEVTFQFCKFREY